MKILFVMLHPGFIRYFDGALRALAAGGHHIHVAFEISRDKLGEDVLARRMADSSGRITIGTTPVRTESVRSFLARSDRSATRSGEFVNTAGGASWEEAWESLATTVRLLLDYLRYFEPPFAHARKLRDRAEKRLPRVYVSLARLVARGGSSVRRCLGSVLRALERVIPTNAALETFIRDHHPDLLLVTPLIELGSQQVDYVKCAERLGVRSALCVASWDNLTSKGLIRTIPDHVVVWNEAQKSEAVGLHGVPPERILITGAQLFDEWFDAQPSRSRQAFCQRVGLDPGRPFVLYVGSSIFIAPDEMPFVERWILRLRHAADPAVASLGVLLRPHPANSRQWRALDMTTFENVAIWPPIGTDPSSADFRRDYFDSLYHSVAVVGINTSAQIEAGIVGRPVFTVRAPEFAQGQDGTLHFQYLIKAEGGLVRAADTLDEHVEQLAATLGGAFDADAARRFVRSFIRPRGLEVAATPVFVEAIETIQRLPRPAAGCDSWWVSVARPPAAGLAYAARTLADDRPLWVYLLRPVLTLGVVVSAFVLRIRAAAQRFLDGRVKHVRRHAHNVWYESSQRANRTMRRANKTFVRRMRSAGVAAKRVMRGLATKLSG